MQNLDGVALIILMLRFITLDIQQARYAVPLQTPMQHQPCQFLGEYAFAREPTGAGWMAARHRDNRPAAAAFYDRIRRLPFLRPRLESLNAVCSDPAFISTIVARLRHLATVVSWMLGSLLSAKNEKRGAPLSGMCKLALPFKGVIALP